jgi:hypothetical protein
MKFNWGTGIAIFYIIFASVMISLVVRSFGHDNSLVREDYYKYDLGYQKHYDKLVNARNLTTDLQIEQHRDAKELLFRFPDDLGAIKGQIHFYRPSGKDLDFRVPVQAEAPNTELVLSTDDLAGGLWQIRVEWEAGGIDYYKEESFQF